MPTAVEDVLELSPPARRILAETCLAAIKRTVLKRLGLPSVAGCCRAAAVLCAARLHARAAAAHRRRRNGGLRRHLRRRAAAGAVGACRPGRRVMRTQHRHRHQLYSIVHSFH